MIRLAYTTLAFVMLAAWAGAQGPPRAALSASEQLRLHRANRVLLVDLVDRGIDLGVANHPVDRAEACRKTARVLGVALLQAAESNDADRVAELGGHLESVVRDGLVPMIDEARRNIHPASPDSARLKLVRDTAASDLDGATKLPEKLADQPQVKDVVGKLGGLKERLK
jgi:hypothetical protein